MMWKRTDNGTERRATSAAAVQGRTRRRTGWAWLPMGASLLLFLALGLPAFSMGRLSADGKKQAAEAAKAGASEDSAESGLTADADENKAVEGSQDASESAKDESGTKGEAEGAGASAAPTQISTEKRDSSSTEGTASAEQKPDGDAAKEAGEGAGEGAPEEAAKKDEQGGQEGEKKEGEEVADDGLINFTLKGAKIDDIIQFIAKHTGKPVIKKSKVDTAITVSAPERITPLQALDYVYDALLLEGFAVLESEDRIQIVPVAEVKEYDLVTITGAIPEEFLKRQSQLVRRVISLKSAAASSLKTYIEPLLGKHAAISADDHTNKLIVTDTVRNIQRYEKILNELDTIGFAQLEINIVPLKYAEAESLSETLRAFVAGTVSPPSTARPPGEPPQGGRPPGAPQPPGGQPQPQLPGAKPAPTAGPPVTILPIERTNSILVAAPKEKYGPILDLIARLDVPKPREVEVNVVEVKYADASELSAAIAQLFPKDRKKAEKDQVEVVTTGRDDALIIVASKENFELVRDVIRELDTEDAQKRETRTYKLKYLDAADTAEELGELYGSLKQSTGWDDFYYPWYSSRRRRDEKEVKFVPVTRTNSVMAIAPPSEFELIEDLIAEIDRPLDKEEVIPKIYRIRHSDATSVEKVLNVIFGNTDTDDRGGSYYYWRYRSSQGDKGPVGRLAGKIRFSADENTNSIIAITNNRSNYDVVDAVIKELDRAQDDMANTMIIALEHADAVELATELNGLFGRPVQPQQQRDRGQEAEAIVQAMYYGAYWGESRRGAERERPISNLIEQVRFVPDKRTNALLVTTASHNFNVIRGLVEQLDKAEPQVMIKARIVEIKKGKGKKIGLRWTPDPDLYSQDDLDNAIQALVGMELLDSFGSGGRDGPMTVGSEGMTDHSLSKTLSEGNGVLSANVNVDLLLQLLLRNYDSEIRINPTLYVGNNKEGKIQAGELLPRSEGSTISSGGTESFKVTYYDAGVTLKITPRINKNGTVVMTVYLTTSEATGKVRFGSDVLQKNEYDTEIAVQSGETMVMGGIRSSNTRKTVRRIPLLGQIPVIGIPFRNYDTRAETTDLYVFLTPVVVFSEVEARSLTDEYLERVGGAEEETAEGFQP